jgi:hypothetical protein
MLITMARRLGQGRHLTFALAALTSAVAATGTAGAATSQLGISKNLSYSSADSSAGPGEAWSAKAGCAGKRVAVGGGVAMGGTIASGFETASYPVGRRHRAWATRGFNASGVDTVTQTTYAICAKRAYHAAFRTNTAKLPDSPSGTSATAKCGTSRHVVGGGVRIKGSPEGVHLNTSSPIDGPDQDTELDDGWRSFAGNDSSGKRRLIAWAICREGGAARDSGGGMLDPAPDTYSDDLQCYAGPFQAVVSLNAGLYVSGPIGQSHIQSIGPYDDAMDADSRPDDGWSFAVSNDAGSSKTVSEYGYCK